MKTSNKFITAACALLLATVVFYNSALRAEYRTGAFRNPITNLVTLPTQGFDAVTVEGASLANVSIQPGPYCVRVSEPVAEVLQVQQQGRHLTLRLRFPREARSYVLKSGKSAIVITCPTLVSVRTDATYSVNGQAQTDLSQPFYNECPVLVRGFRQDSLLVQADNGSRVELRDNVLGRLRVVAGRAAGAPIVRLHPGNRIQQASFAMGGKSKLVFDELTIPDLRYQFADSATTTLPGRSLSALLPPGNTSLK